MTKYFAVLLAVSSMALRPAAVSAATEVALRNGNATARIQLDTSAGMYSWVVDGGANQLFVQWFWWRAGDTGPEQPISDLTLSTHSQPSSDSVTSTYAHGGGLFQVSISYVLIGGAAGSGLARIEEAISVENTSGATLEFHLFQYTDFDLGGTPGGETIVLGAGGSGVESAKVSETGFNFSESVTLTPAQRAEADLFDGTFAKLNDADADDLSNELSAGPGDVTFAFQWDAVLAASGSGSRLEIVKRKSLTVPPIPEPNVAGLLGLAGLTGLLTRAIRSRAQWRKENPAPNEGAGWKRVSRP